MQYFIFNLKKFLNLAEDNASRSNISRNETGAEYPSYIKIRVQQIVIVKLSKIEEAYSEVLRKLESSQNEEINEELRHIKSFLENNNNSFKREKL